jgi:lantibiotic modifying enzyme
MKWQPILNERLQKTAAEKITEIANTLADEKNLFEKDKIGLINGRAGVALFFFYYARFARCESSHNRAQEILTEVFDILSGEHDFHSHTSGLAGIGWLVEHLVRGDFLDAATDEILADADAVLYPLMIDHIKEGKYDFLHAAVGHAVYFLSRLPNLRAGEYLEHFVNVLESISMKDQEGGIKWQDHFSLGSHAKTVFNLGMAHGIPAIVVFLAKMIKSGIAVEKSLRLLNGAVEYILRQALDREKYGCFFPDRVIEGEFPTQTRMGWCYGDPGVAMALWLAAQAAGNREWERKAVEVFVYGAGRRPPEAHKVADATMCHGTAGVAHIYNRLFHHTGMEIFKETAQYWFRCTFKMAVFADGLAGYKKQVSREKGDWANSACVLDGIAGIGLALIAAVSDIEPAWDECLFLS